MGINGTNLTENTVFGTDVYEFGKTYLVIVKATFDSEGNGECSLFINPQPAATEPAPAVSTPLTTLKAIRGITVRQRNASSLAAQVGGIRFAKSWDAVGIH